MDELQRGEASGGEGFRTYGPDGGYPREAGELAPEMGEIQPEERSLGGGVDRGALLAGEECRVADDEGGVGSGNHGGGIGG